MICALSTNPMPPTFKNHVLLAYVADLELEVDRLRTQRQFLEQAAWPALNRIQLLCAHAEGRESTINSLEEIDQTTKRLASVLSDLQEPPGYHPAHDQVIAIAVRPLIEQVFRWQQRSTGRHKSCFSWSWKASTWSGSPPVCGTFWTT